MKISVIGCGYLGSTHAAAMASLGFQVVGVDLNPNKIESLKQGIVPFFEPDLEKLTDSQIKSGRLKFSTEYDSVADCDIHFICVGTPQRQHSFAADISQVEASVELVARHAKRGALIVGKSTVPVGTADSLANRIRDFSLGIDIAWNPEFLREGFAVEDTLRPNRIVVGVSTESAEEKLREVYKSIIENGVPFISTDLKTAELVKLAANSFLATKISFINAMAEICEASGGDVVALAKAIGLDPRIGPQFLQAGVGFGGGCLPKDIRAFMARAEELGKSESLRFLRDIEQINYRARKRVLELTTSLLGKNFKSKRVAVLGAAFKPNSDDVRESPALFIASEISSSGAKVTVYDPRATLNAKSLFPQLNYATSVETCLERADLVLHLTDWQEFRHIDAFKAKKLVANPIIVDGRNSLERSSWESAGWKFIALGKGMQKI